MATTNNDDLDAVMRRIQKLLAIAHDGRGNQNEAAAAASMAEKIMRKYQLEHSDVIMASLKRGEDMDSVNSLASAKTNGTKVKVVPLWANIISVQVAALNEVRASIVRVDGEAHLRFYGFKSDVQVSKWMFEYLISTVLKLCKQFKEESPHYRTFGRREVNSYRQGVAVGICHQIQEMLKEKSAEIEAAGGTGKELVVCKKNAIDSHFGEGASIKSIRSKVSGGSSFSNGVTDGKKVDINRRGIDGESTQLLGRD